MLGLQIFPPDVKYTLDKVWINLGLGLRLDKPWTWTMFGLCLDLEQTLNLGANALLQRSQL